ncbi:hypothetical protein [Legionella yabuuchiae]|uniref:hypothetical protein n=1 Tax=Legionella yabuuchiae TaxID=376727 RepID=UPI001054CE3D|nr:hypothetical protein [Legionella yabuuchiae]
MNRISQLFLLMFLTHSALGEPPFEVIQSCMTGKATMPDLTIKEIEEDGFTSDNIDNCEARYNRHFKHHLFGMVVCGEEFFLVRNHEKIRFDTAINHSLNPRIKPGIPFTVRSFWKKIDFKGESYLCIESPLSESGVGASINQYYIIEHGFEETTVPILYYYFFNGDVRPVFSI